GERCAFPCRVPQTDWGWAPGSARLASRPFSVTFSCCAAAGYRFAFASCRRNTRYDRASHDRYIALIQQAAYWQIPWSANGVAMHPCDPRTWPLPRATSHFPAPKQPTASPDEKPHWFSVRVDRVRKEI